MPRGPHKTDPARRLTRAGAALPGPWWGNWLAPVFLSLILVATAATQFLLFHSLAELFAISVAVTVFVVAWNTFPFTYSSFLLYVGCGYLWIAGLDLIHTLTYRGMGVFPIAGANTATQFWVAGRLYEALVLFSAPFFLHRQVAPRLVLGATGAAFVLLCGLIVTGVFPTAYVEGVGLTRFKVGSEYTIVLILLGAILLLQKRRGSMDANVNRFISIAAGLTAVAELVFTLYVEIVSTAMVIGHLLKFWSYWFVYVALVQFTLRNPFLVLGRQTGAYDAFPEPTALVDRHGTIRQANKALLQSHRESVLGRPCHESLHPAGLPRSECTVCHAIAQGTPAQGLELYFPEPGQWQEITLTPYFWSSRTVGIVHVARDVTVRNLARDAMAKELDRAKGFFDVAEVMLLALDVKGRITSINRKAAAVLGAPEAELIGQLWFDRLPGPQQAAARALFADVLKGQTRESRFHEGEAITRSGERRLIAWHTAPLRDNTGRVIGTLSSGEDVTERRRDEARLRQAASVYEASSNGVIITDAGYQVVAVNPAFTRITGFTEKDMVGRHGDTVLEMQQDPKFIQALHRQLESEGGWQGEMHIRRKSGAPLPVWEHVSALRDQEGRVTYYIAVLTDISPLKASEERLDQLAHHDPLTGKPNRLLFHARLTHALERAAREGTRLAVLFVDLDRFKHVNDTYGHEAGDRVLVETAARIAACVRAEDTVARMGGDEFTVLLEPLHRAGDAARVAQQIVETVRAPIALDGGEATVGASVGISIYPEHGLALDDLLHNADVAMYRAKQAGRNNYQFYTEELTRSARERRSLELALRRAIERAELVLHFQPQVEVQTGKVMSVEALVRWCHPERGMLLPEHFVPFAEEVGLVGELDTWALNTACVQGRRWRAEGLPIRVAVNLSGKRLVSGEWLENVQTILRHTGLEPGCLELEITEGCLMASADETLGRLRALKALGVALVMDHFGTGYTSLSHLERFPLDKLKIAPSVIARILSDENDAAVARAIIALGHTLHLTVTATGVSDPAQLAFLGGKDAAGPALADADQYQGVLCTPPLPAEELGPWMHSSQRCPPLS
ncbi:MAG: EAL domain-containing protein [Gammaproteobacteria bacterium]|nr:EAL domain-containing protein [Gammaproteobacteria bacterium]